MAMTTEEQISFNEETFDESVLFMNKAINEKNLMLSCLNAGAALKSLLELGILKWRRQENPQSVFSKMISFSEESEGMLTLLDDQFLQKCPLHGFLTIYIAFLLNKPFGRLPLDSLSGQPKIAGFLGNVILGYDDISNWILYKDILPANKRHNLARRTNELYVGLLSGNVSAKEGVNLGESLWSEREDDSFYADSLSGNGIGNERMVDYQLGAILKKIGSTVPTVHAWRW